MSVKIARTVDDLTYPQPVDLPMSWSIVGSAVRARRFLGADPIERAAVMTRRILERVRDERSPPPSYRVVNVDGADMLYDDLGDIFLAGEADLGEPIFPRAARGYRRSLGNGLLYARIEPHKSYRDFRAEDAGLADRVAELEAIIHRHMADGHGGQILGEYLQELEDLRDAANAATAAERHIPLSMPPGFEGKWDCWLDQGGEIVCCSIGLRGPRGDLRIATSAAPVERHAVDLVRAARLTGCNTDELAGVLPTIACMLGGGSLASHLAAASPALLARPEASGSAPFVGCLAPARRHSLACLLGVLQDAQRGDDGARQEWEGLAHVAEHLDHPRARRLGAAMCGARSLLVAGDGGGQLDEARAVTDAFAKWSDAKSRQDPTSWIFKGPSDAEVATLRADFNRVDAAFRGRYGYSPADRVTTPGGVLTVRA